ncbi:MAG: formylglycine-generating enzyme family protein [Chloroflexi bacterium]|nr:formylglycine-generating enzyme family protein [Chloroflexota bacterium]MBV9895376.1 formylglycine-generating enzyme family protein [Chloroflexota bacterium]
MVWIPGGNCTIGSELPGYPEESPLRTVSVDGFWMDEHPVTVAEFREFILDTGYTTVASRAPDPAAFPGVDRSRLVPGSLVFNKTKGPVDLKAALQRPTLPWWSYVAGAEWRRPEGPGSHVGNRAQHPVVHVAWEDVCAYADWAGKAIPTEAEWEFAARGGLEGAMFTWGDDMNPDGRIMAKTWQGEFPWKNAAPDGWERTAPVGSFPPNGFGLFDMAGNVWEWTTDYYAPDHASNEMEHACCAPANPRVESVERSYDPADMRADRMPRRVIKGGSHLCAPNYCLRFRPAARQPQMEDSSMSHIGFRCVIRE